MSQPLVGRVSRRELALNRYVWLATGGMFMVFGVATCVFAFLPIGTDLMPMLIFGGSLTVVAAWLLATQPPAIGTARNHIVLSLVYLATAAGTYAFQPGGAAAIGAAMFIGPLTAVRLVDRREIGAHYLAATITLLTLPLLGLVDTSTFIAGLTAIPSTWVLGLCCVVVLEGAEAQGEELEVLVRRDPLTGVGNRRQLSELLPTELKRHSRTHRPLSIIALDLNGFKALNDTMGHAAGDALLRDVASALTATVQPQDTVVRQGGDEFCILLPETSPEAAARMAADIRTALARLSDEHGAPISSGMGIATFPTDAVHGGVLLHLADERLREDKAETPLARGSAPADASAPTDLKPLRRIS